MTLNFVLPLTVRLLLLTTLLGIMGVVEGRAIVFSSPVTVEQFIVTTPPPNVVTAASCSQTDVQTAFTAATASGVTVQIPAGTCTWTTAVSWTAPANATVRGAGTLPSVGSPGNTVITDNLDRSGFDAGMLNLTTNASGTFRLSGITFLHSGNTNTDTFGGSLRIGGSSQAMRLDHLQITGSSKQFVALLFSGELYGVVDHSQFDPYAGVSIKFFASGWGGATDGDGSWADDTTLGSNRFVYLEDNVFIGHSGGNGTQDSYQGSRFVMRYNTLTNLGGFQTHPTGGSGRARGTRAWEIYGNTLLGPMSGSNGFNVFFLSSGTGVIWGNDAGSGLYSNFVTIHSMRVSNETYTQTATPNGWGYCGTDFNGTGSNWDENSSVATGYACLDQPGRGRGDLLSGAFPSVSNVTLGCTVATACWPRQALEPVYEWGNTWACPSCGGGFWQNYDATVMSANRDYYLYTGSFTGATGVGSGVRASRPTTCTTGVAYWSTDQGGNWHTTNGTANDGTLDRCTATDTWTNAVYTPYTYPNPLVQ